MKPFVLFVLLGFISFISQAQEMTTCGACFGRGYIEIRPMSSTIAYSTDECVNCRQTYRVSQGHSHACVYCQGTRQIAVSQNWSNDPYYMMALEYANKNYGTGSNMQQNNNTQTQQKQHKTNNRPKPIIKKEKIKILGKTITLP